MTWEWFVTWPVKVLAILVGGLIALVLVRRLISLLAERIAAGYYRAYADAIDEQLGTGVGTSVAAAAAGVETTVIRSVKSRPWLRKTTVVEEALGSADPEVQQRRAQRARTVGAVLNSAATIVIVATMVLMILSVVGADKVVTPLLTSAGVLGVAIGFGAQSLVRDFLSGIFILIEDQYGVGDVVDLGAGAVGTVEHVDLRLTHVRAFDGTLWHVRNGEILRAGNQTQQWSRAIASIVVPISEPVGEVRAALGRAADQVVLNPPMAGDLLEAPSVRGIDAMSDGTYTFTIYARVRPGRAGDVQRAFYDEARFELASSGLVGGVGPVAELGESVEPGGGPTTAVQPVVGAIRSVGEASVVGGVEGDGTDAASMTYGVDGVSEVAGADEVGMTYGVGGVEGDGTDAAGVTDGVDGVSEVSLVGEADQEDLGVDPVAQSPSPASLPTVERHSIARFVRQ